MAGTPLTAQTETGNDVLIALWRSVFEIVEELAALIHHLQQAATRRVIALVRREVFAQLVDACRKQRDLYFRRTRIGLVASILLDDSAFLCAGQ